MKCTMVNEKGTSPVTGRIAGRLTKQSRAESQIVVVEQTHCPQQARVPNATGQSQTQWLLQFMKGDKCGETVTSTVKSQKGVDCATSEIQNMVWVHAPPEWR
jgi:hypothetical protein